MIIIKAIILAAGQGTRLKKYTKDLPKGMLEFAGKTIIKHQIDLYREIGIDDIIIIRGYAGEKINYQGVKYYNNPKYEKTNMVYTLFCAEKELNDDIIISYSDILFKKELLNRLIKKKEDIVLPVDINWKEYWQKRYGKVNYDIESLQINDEGNVTNLGEENVSLKKIDARYIGLLKFSKTGVKKLKNVWNKNKKEFWNKPWKTSNKTLKNAYMTDILQALIDEGNPIKALCTNNGWLEFDTNEDYEKAKKWYNDNQIDFL